MSFAKRAALLTGVVVVASIVAVATPAGAGVTPTTGVATATLTVTKVVQGNAPADAEFAIEVSCESSGTTELTFGSSGGSEEVTLLESDVCTVFETDTGGAVDATGPIEVEILEPTDYAAVVTNVFDRPADTSSSTTAATRATTATRPTFTG